MHAVLSDGYGPGMTIERQCPIPELHGHDSCEFLNPKLAAALAALVDAEKKLLQFRPLPDQTLLV